MTGRDSTHSYVVERQSARCLPKFLMGANSVAELVIATMLMGQLPLAHATDAKTARASMAAKAMQRSSLGSVPMGAQLQPQTDPGSGGGDASSFDPANYFENKELIRAPRAITTLGPDLFGDSVNLYRGGLEFIQTDVNLQGTSKIPVAITRRLVTGGMGNYTGGLFSEWDLEIPHIHGTFLSGGGWVRATGAGQATNQRCTNFGAPPDVPYSVGAPGWRAIEFWRGNNITVPGAGTQEILRRNTSNNNIPNDGQTTPLVTSGNWAIRCLSTLASTSSSTPYGEQGEGFLAIAPDGTKYRFDWLVSRPTGGISKQANVAGAHISASRSEVWILPTVVTDRFGNTVTYTYDTTDKWKILSIRASDGRQLTFSYISGSRRIQSITDGARTWTYTYEAATGSSLISTYQQLVNVTLPDGSAWDFHGMSVPNGYSETNSGLIYMNVEIAPPSPENPVTQCDTGTYMSAGFYSVPATGSMTHPSGAVGTFTLTPLEHGRDLAPYVCYSDGIPNSVGKAAASRFVVNFALTNKTITGPGLPSMSWSYDYDTWYPSWNDGSGYQGHVATVSVTDPSNNVTRHTFGNRFNIDEGKPLKIEVLNSSGNVLRTTSLQYNTTQFTTQLGVSDQQSGDGLLNGRYMPVNQRTITQQGSSFTWQATSFDAFARATAATLSSSLAYSRSETTTYFDQTSLWVLGQIDTITSGGLNVVDHDYNASTATLASTKKFGIVQASYAYNSDGTLASRTDGRNNTTYFGNYKLGIPQTVSFPTGASRSAVVDNIGLITSVTDEASYTTGYGYDAMGRLASVTPPGGFTATSLIFEKVSAAEYGLPANHWRQTVSLGNSRTTNYFDAFWRPVMTRTYDAQQETATRKVIVKAFDFNGRTSFESYPQRDITSVSATSPGQRMQYDALGRITQTQADSELGNLTTSTSYLPGFQTQTTNPRGKVTTQSFWALDDPAKAQLAAISAPAGASVSISRDTFGKPTAITRGGTSVGTNAGYTSSVTRRYVYDAGQRLCKTLEPEVGATVQTYDAASNIAWKAPGQNLPSTTSCDDASVGATAKLTYGYDNLNRLSSVSYGDGSPGISRTYTADGLLQTIASNGSTWTYSYNALRKPAIETLNYAGQNYGLSWSYNTAGDLSTLTYPDNSSVSYSPNALGEAQSVAGYASGISYHPNGAVAGYTLNNGIAHSLTQNTRGLPLVNRDAGVMQDQYAYDANGNVASITDQQEGVFSRSMGYDDLDRLASASAPNVWGNATYKYDTVDNLRSANVGSRSSALKFGDTTNQLETVTTNGAVTNYNFDSRGNLTTKGGQSFGFDLGNRLTSSSLGGSYTYDGLGRRFRIASTDGSTRIQIYSQAGQILWATSTGGPRANSNTAYIYLGGKQIAEVNSAAGVQYVHTDALGSPVAHTGANGALINRSRFEPYGYVAAGTKPSANTSVIGFTGHVQDAETDLVYMQQRYYDPLAGRFLSVDPVVTDANTGKEFGRYTYVENNPYARVDPNGALSEAFWASPTKVIITIPYRITEYGGARAGFTKAAFERQVAKDFSGTAKVGDRTVTIEARAEERSKGKFNEIQVVGSTEGITQSGRAEARGGLAGNPINTIVLGSKDGADVASHEMGHAAGAGDQYKGGRDKNLNLLTADVPGNNNRMRDNGPAGANQQTRNEIAERHVKKETD